MRVETGFIFAYFPPFPLTLTQYLIFNKRLLNEWIEIISNPVSVWWAAVQNTRAGGLNNKNLFFRVLKARSMRSRCQQSRFLCNPLNFASRWPCSPVSSHGPSSVCAYVLILPSYNDCSHSRSHLTASI
uniref:Uncharacterized protein n=1 Tax=Rousettus aegyptiacus TaxID=9407 RepID=A0A7J8DIG1_ROUAE|nr:hypothetical protein HJG63_008642 [Rousettus aegyptiacus]